MSNVLSTSTHLFLLFYSDYPLLVIPVLRILYSCPEKSSHHVYMSLIILLILTEDGLFNEAVHDIVSLFFESNIQTLISFYK